MLYTDRIDAGRQLGEAARDSLASLRDPVVLGLPRGGVPVAAGVADALNAPLDVVVVRKLGAPTQPEFAVGAIGENGVRVVDDATRRVLALSDDELDRVEAAERIELERRIERYRGDAEPVPVAGRSAVIVDDGVATGSTLRAACLVVRALGAERVIAAVPVAPPGWERRLRDHADDYLALSTPDGFMAVGQWYRDFTQSTDDEVSSILAAHRASARR